MTRPRLFVEPLCGSAAVTLRLLGGASAKPPISYMGSKRGYATTILGVLGLRPGQGADEVWLNDLGPWGSVWSVLAAPGGAEAVAEVMRGWADEDPRSLWDEWKATLDPRLTGEVAEPPRVAAWLQVGAWAYEQGNPSVGYCGPEGGRPQTLTTATATARVAQWLQAGAWSYRQGDISSGGPVLPGQRRQDTTVTATATATAGVAVARPGVKVNVTRQDVTSLAISGDCSGVVVYMDPPYVGTTGYGHDCPRSEVLTLARRWSDAGATVAISEAVALAEELGQGWHAVRIDGERRGQARTFSKQQAEWLTLNRPPAHVPGVQTTLF